MYPVLLVQNSFVTPAKKFFERRKSRHQLEMALQKFEKENEALRSELIELRSRILYEEDISELVAFKKKYDLSDALVAQIIFRQISPEGHFILLDKGTRHQVTKDMVALYKNSVVGKVIEVYPFYSKLILITDSLCKVAAHCSKTKASGIHVGRNEKNSTVLEKVSHLSSVQEDDVVISSGEGLVFPRGFALGKIKTVQREDLFFNISVEPLIDLDEISYCMLIKKGTV